MLPALEKTHGRFDGEDRLRLLSCCVYDIGMRNSFHMIPDSDQ